MNIWTEFKNAILPWLLAGALAVATAAFAGFGIPVAGKSGTAESGGPDPHAWFPAYAPADDPTISVATVLPNIPLGTGGSDAARRGTRSQKRYATSTGSMRKSPQINALTSAASTLG